MVGVGKKSRRSFTIDEDLGEELGRRDDINASAVVNRFLREYLVKGEGPDVALAIRIEEIERELENKRAERARLQSRIEELERQRETVQRRMDDRTDVFEEQLTEFVEKVEDSEFPRENIQPDNPAIQNAAVKGNVTPDRFCDELEGRL